MIRNNIGFFGVNGYAVASPELSCTHKEEP
jgi:hypothetical protein